MGWAEYEEAFCHTPAAHRIMGRLVRPFSYYHLFYLRLIESPLLGLGGRAVGVADVEIASRICAVGTYGAVDECLPRWRRWGRWSRWNVCWWWRLWRHGRHLAAECAAFEAYVDDYVTVPETHGDMQAGGGKVGGAGQRVYERFPSTLAPICGLIYWTKWPAAVCWMLPMGQVHWYLMGFRWYKGEDTKLVDEQDREFRAHLTKLRGQQAASGPEVAE